MDIEIVGIKEKGNLDKERIVLKALSDLELGFVMVFLTVGIKGKSFTSTPESVFWFPDKQVSKGDLIVLYTKKGKNTEHKNAGGNTSHFFYMNIDKHYFDTPDKIAVLIEANGWKTSD
jgi:hypothetical protein